MNRYEFGSNEWAAAVCKLVDELLARERLPVDPYSFSEEYTQPPAHLTGHALGWHLVITDGVLTTGTGPLHGASYSVITEYDVVAPFVSLSYREHPEVMRLARAAVAPALKDGRFRISGQRPPNEVLPGFHKLHDKVADVTLPCAKRVR